jgi:hypothetical protein
MLDSDDPALWYAINRLITNYWADVDDNGGSQAHEFYEPAAVYTVGANRFEGADKDPRLLYPAPATVEDHHASPYRQSKGIPRRRTSCRGGRGDDPLSRRRPSTD